MNLSDFLTPAEVASAQEMLREKLARIEQERQAELTALNERFDLLQKEAGRSVLASVLGVSAPTATEAPATIAVAPQTGGLTAREIGAALGYHKDSVNNWVRNGLLPAPVAGTGGHPHNPARYVVDLEALRTKVEARQEAAKVNNATKLAKEPPVLSGATMSWDRAAGILGVSRDTVRLYIKRGMLTGRAGLVTVESVNHYKANRLPPGQTHARIAQAEKVKATSSPVKATPTPKDEEVQGTEIIVEPRPAPQLDEAVKHDYHWRNALPVLEAAIAAADVEGEVAIEVAYQSTPDDYTKRGAFVVRPFGQLGPGLMAFVRATKESGTWSVTIPLRVESWIKPMAEGLVAYWRGRTIAASLPNPSSVSATRSLQA